MNLLTDEVLQSCRLCPRNCGVNRCAGETGYCGAGERARVSNIMLHKWEEPCISGYGGEKDVHGSGAVFFVHCNLGCLYCQNRTISCHDSRLGRTMDTAELSSVFLHLQAKGACNLNLVTPTHYAAQIARALTEAKANGLTMPVVWNTGGYESVEVLSALEGLVDIYLTDFKYASSALAGTLSAAVVYPEVAEKALAAMVSQVGQVRFDEKGMLRRGVIVRHLVLPGHRQDSIEVLRRVAAAVEPDMVRISLMRQYTPDFLKETMELTPKTDIPKALYRRVTAFEYQSVVDEALRLGFDGYTQEKDSAMRTYTPDFR